MVLVGLVSGKVVVVDVQCGLLIWEQWVVIFQGCFELDCVVDIDGGFLLFGDIFYVVSYQGCVVVLDVNSGCLFWQCEVLSYVGVVEGFGNIYVSQVSGLVEGLDLCGVFLLWNNDVLVCC